MPLSAVQQSIPFPVGKEEVLSESGPRESIASTIINRLYQKKFKRKKQRNKRSETRKHRTVPEVPIKRTLTDTLKRKIRNLPSFKYSNNEEKRKKEKVYEKIREKIRKNLYPTISVPSLKLPLNFFSNSKNATLSG